MTDSWLTIVHSAKRFFSGTMISRISGMLRDITMAYAFGATPLVATFLLAFRLSNLFRRVFGEGAMQSAFTPLFEKIRVEDSLKAAYFFRDLAFTVSLFLLGLIFFFASALLLLPALTSAFSSTTVDLFSLTALMLPSLLFICLYGLHASLLQCQKNYFIPAVAPAAFNLVWIAAVFCLDAYFSERTAIYLLAVAIVFAAFTQWAITLPASLVNLKSLGVDSLTKNLSFRSDELKGLITPLLLGIGGVAATQINSALDGLFGWWADPSGPAYLWFAIRLQQLPLSLWAIALSGALLPPLCRAAKEKNNSFFYTFFSNAVRTTILSMSLATTWLFVAGYSCVALLFGHGDFSVYDSIQTTYCCWGYSLGLVPMGLVLIVSAAFYSQHQFRIPMLCSCFSVAGSISLNSLFVFNGFGAAAIAVATSLSALINLLCLLSCFSLPDNSSISLKKYCIYPLAISFAAFFVTFTFDWLYWGNSHLYELLILHIEPEKEEIVVQLLRIGLQAFLFLLTAFSVEGIKKWCKKQLLKSGT